MLGKILSKHSKPTLIQTDQGQMAIFVALMFQVLFVLFAMSINVALVVHDKINLQNSVDLAAYYGAQRQAEILNAIAHQNYQIRQAWKLLAFRQNVLGTMGVLEHPTLTGNRADAVAMPRPGNPSVGRSAICTLFDGVWPEAPANDNLCKGFDWRISALPNLPNVAPFNPINLILQRNLSQLSARIEGQCKSIGAQNWYFGAITNTAFRVFQMNNRDVILSLANTLKNNDFITLDGGPVSTGVGKTVFKNLTYENRAGQIQPDDNFNLQIFNSMANIDSSQWLAEIQISANFTYLDIVPGLNGSACGAQEKPYSAIPAEDQVLDSLPGSDRMRRLMASEDSEEIFNNKYRMTLGVEKNPWYQVYFGVKATTAPREIFSPFNVRVPMTARAFAKPFGGRIGPWYRHTWPKGSPISTGSKVDALLPERKSPTAMGVGSFHFPNFSRHPSDAVGSYSARYMNSIVNLRGTIQPRFAYFSFIFNEYANGQINDPLAWSNTLQTNTPTRIMELGAIAPDLFDANYYSVIPNYTSVVLPKLRANRGALGIPDNLALQGDLGSHGNSFQADIHYQFQTAKPLHAPDAFFYLEDFRHLLTGWVTNSYNNYRNMFPSTKFGRCSAADTGPGTNYQPKFKIPNSCLQGGRSGYSVKMVSKDFLTSELQDVSGTKGQTGSLENPPPADF